MVEPDACRGLVTARISPKPIGRAPAVAQRTACRSRPLTCGKAHRLRASVLPATHVCLILHDRREAAVFCVLVLDMR